MLSQANGADYHSPAGVGQSVELTGREDQPQHGDGKARHYGECDGRHHSSDCIDERGMRAHARSCRGGRE